jgi:hypothetical protein
MPVVEGGVWGKNPIYLRYKNSIYLIPTISDNQGNRSIQAIGVIPDHGSRGRYKLTGGPGSLFFFKKLRTLFPNPVFCVVDR